MEIAGIERELRELWQHMSPHKDQEGQAITRACVFNLIVYAPGRQGESTVNQIMVDVTEENPGRIFVLLPGEEGTSSGLNAWVTAQCHLASGGRKQVCCEQIMIRASGESVRHLPSVVVPLLVPDIPVFVWWRGAIFENNEMLQTLVESADRLILDSIWTKKYTVKDSIEIIRQIHGWIRQWGDQIAVSDMRWGELTALRYAIARFYDNPKCRSFLSEITHVEIECVSTALVSILLFVGWLGSRLKWKWTGEPGDFSSVKFRSGRRDVHVSIKPYDVESGEKLKVHLSAAEKSPAEFTIQADRESGHLISEMNAPGECNTRDVVRLDPDSESLLLNNELSILNHDRIYEEALEFLLQPELPETRKSRKRKEPQMNSDTQK